MLCYLLQAPGGMLHENVRRSPAVEKREIALGQFLAVKLPRFNQPAARFARIYARIPIPAVGQIVSPSRYRYEDCERTYENAHDDLPGFL